MSTAPPRTEAPAEPTPLQRVAGSVDRRKGLRRVPEVARSALGVVHDASPRTLYTTLVLQVVSAVVLGAQLLVVKRLVASLVTLARDTGAPVSTVIPSFVLLLVATVLNGVITAVLSNQQRMLTELVTRRVTDRIIDVASRIDLARFEDPSFYDHLERATTAGMFRPIEMVNALMALLLGVLTSVGIMIALATLEPLLLPLVLVAAVPVLIATLQNSRQAYAFEYNMTTQARERLHLFELFTERESAKELRVFAATPFLRSRYDGLSDERIGKMRAFLNGRLRVSVIGTLAGAVGAGIALGSLIWLLSAGRLSISSAAAAAIAMFVLSSRLGAVTGSLGKLVESGMFLDDLRAFFVIGREQDERDARPRTGRLLPGFDSLQVDRLSFTYPDTERPVLQDVSMEINRGEVVAIVGENGSGKTTLVKLLCQLYEVQEGTVRWNGTDVRELDPDRLRDTMTVLFQDFVQYYLSASENIALGRASAPLDEAEVREAARQAGAARAIEALPRGYATRLGRQFEGGHELSGGQWQRLALARAFYRGGDFLVMDEPTAALDPRAEHELFEQIRTLAAGKSVLLISHRFANVRSADRIYVLESGRVAESGRHEELMALDGLYAELFRLQAASYLDEEDA